jgi:hypothetical protein
MLLAAIAIAQLATIGGNRAEATAILRTRQIVDNMSY